MKYKLTELTRALQFNQESFNKIYKSEVDEIFTYMDVREGALVVIAVCLELRSR